MSLHLLDHERPQWRVLSQVDKYAADIDWYRRRYGKAPGEARFFLEQSPVESIARQGNLLLIGGASILWEALIGNTPTFYSNANANIGVSDGGPTALSGTVSVTNGSPTATFSTSQSTVNGNFITVVGDSTAGVYKATGSGTSYTLTPNYAGSTNASASASVIVSELATQVDLAGSSNKARNPVDATYPLHADGTGAAAKTITAATNASPIQITATSHGYSTGDFVAISGVGGNTAANGIWQITVVDASNFTLNNSTGNSAYTSGGAASKSPVVVFKSTFGTSTANFGWYDWGIWNATSSGRLLNRKVTSLGTKTSAASWAFTVGIGLQ